MEATQERAKTDIDYKISIIKRLEADMAQREVKHNEEMESVSAKLSAQIKKLEIARENAIRESERLNAAVMQLETQLAAKEKYFQNEKVCYCNVIYHLLQRVSEVGLMFFVSVLFCKIRC